MHFIFGQILCIDFVVVDNGVEISNIFSTKQNKSQSIAFITSILATHLKYNMQTRKRKQQYDKYHEKKVLIQLNKLQKKM